MSDDTDDATVRTDLVIEDVDLHPSDRRRVEEVVEDMLNGGQVYVLPPDASEDRVRLFEALADVNHRIEILEERADG